MPSVRFEEPWVPGFRSAVRTSTAEGWSVREHRGGMRLQVRHAAGSMQTVSLPFDWAQRSTGDALVRIRNIYALVEEGHSIRSAADLLEGKAPATLKPWREAAERFREQKILHGNAIKPSTWEKNYEPVIAMAVELLSSHRAPGRPDDLLDQCIREWEPGSRARQIRAQSLSQFLRSHVGVKPANGSPSRKGDPLTDQQIIDLLAALPDDEAGRRWSDAIRLCSELGLRPIELLHLSVRRDPSSREFHWWCGYSKRSGGGATEPRRLESLPLIDQHGEVQQWNLLNRWLTGDITLPPLESGNGAAECLKTYLNRQKAWVQLKVVMAAAGERLVPYSFRHSYSLRCHQRGIDGGSAAAAMGHSYEVHCRSYPWASEAGVVAAFKRARAQAAPIHG
jgi:integrase